jgi:hypothetical protein
MTMTTTTYRKYSSLYLMDNQRNFSNQDLNSNYLSNLPIKESNIKEGPTVRWQVKTNSNNPFLLHFKREPVGLIQIPDNEQGWSQVRTDNLPELAWEPEAYQETIEASDQEEEPRDPEYRPTSPESFRHCFDPSIPVFCPTQGPTRPVSHKYCFGCHQECLSLELRFCLGCMIHCPSHHFRYQPNLAILEPPLRSSTPTFLSGSRVGQETAPSEPEQRQGEDQLTAGRWLTLNTVYHLNRLVEQEGPLDLTSLSTRT